MKDYIVKKISRTQCAEYILTIHYAKRWPSITYRFGIFKGSTLVGICTFGTPPSPTLRSGLAGKDNIENIIELNRLCLRNNLKNEASFLISKSLKMPPRKKIVISMSDTTHDHVGIVYQACNFRYYGLSAKRTDWKLKNHEHLHNTTLIDEFRGQSNRVQLMREKYGNDFYLSPRSRKHRYVYVTGTKNDRKHFYKQIKYKQFGYPKK